MKQLLFLAMSVFLVACGGNNTESEPSAAAPEATAPASEAAVVAEVTEAVEEAMDGPQPPAMVEFIWHSKAEGYSDEALVAHTTAWSSIPDASGWELGLAAVMTPRFESEDFDFLWVLAWPTLEARDNAWADWAENHEAGWLELTSNTFTYSVDNVYGFSPSPGRMPSAMNTSGTSVAEFLFCAYREGMGETNRQSFEAMHNAFMDAYEAEAGATSYWWTVMSPQFEPQESNMFDYMWTNFFAADAERDAVYAAYEASEHSSQAEADAECTDPAVFDSRVIYRAGA